MNDKPIRLDKCVSQATGISRARAKKIILGQLIKVNDILQVNPAFKVNWSDKVIFKEKRLTFNKHHYLILHKPAGYICSSQDETHPTALNLIDIVDKKNFHFAGRLDVDTTGLVIITSDGKWSHQVTSPKKLCAKTYRVWLDEPIDKQQLKKLEEGILLKGEDKLTRPAKTELIDFQQVLLTIGEGRYHQVKRMFAAINNRVIKLHRESVGGINLSDLAEGEWKMLTDDQVNMFQ